MTLYVEGVSTTMKRMFILMIFCHHLGPLEFDYPQGVCCAPCKFDEMEVNLFQVVHGLFHFLKCPGEHDVRPFLVVEGDLSPTSISTTMVMISLFRGGRCPRPPRYRTLFLSSFSLPFFFFGLLSSCGMVVGYEKAYVITHMNSMLDHSRSMKPFALMPNFCKVSIFAMW